MTVSGNDSEFQSVFVEFDNEVSLNGNFYIVVLAPLNLVFSTPNTISDECTATSTGNTQNKYRFKDEENTWHNCNIIYSIDLTLYTVEYFIKKIENVVFIGKTNMCDYSEVQNALEAIDDDSAENPYVFYVFGGTYIPFTMKYTDNTRVTARSTKRYISIIGTDRNSVVFFDNKGNYKYSPCEIWTNGTIENVSFIDKADSEHHTQETGRNYSFACHVDFGACNVFFRNCYFYCNSGPACGLGTYKDSIIEFDDCLFECENDGTYGETGLGAFFAHTQASGTQTSDRTNQKLRLRNSISVSHNEQYGSRFSTPSGFDGTWSYELQNFGSFGQSGASVSINDPTETLFSYTCFNNTPQELNS